MTTAKLPEKALNDAELKAHYARATEMANSVLAMVLPAVRMALPDSLELRLSIMATFWPAGEPDAPSHNATVSTFTPGERLAFMAALNSIALRLAAEEKAEQELAEGATVN